MSILPDDNEGRKDKNKTGAVVKHLSLKGGNMFTIFKTYVTHAFKSYVKHTGFYTFTCVMTLMCNK